MDATHRLVTYGSLAPGRPNHHHLARLRGRWFTGTVHGNLVENGWGAAIGYPAMVLDSNGPEIEVHVFESNDLPSHWPWLDDFEGPDYCRTAVVVQTSDGQVTAYAYLHRPD